MNLIHELESLKDEIMVIKDVGDKVKARGHINQIIKEAKEDTFTIPEWLKPPYKVTVKAEEE